MELYDAAQDDGRDFDFAGYSTNLAGREEYGAVVKQLHDRLVAAVESWRDDVSIVA